MVETCEEYEALTEEAELDHLSYVKAVEMLILTKSGGGDWLFSLRSVPHGVRRLGGPAKAGAGCTVCICRVSD